MKKISRDDVVRRIQAENPWWLDGSIGKSLSDKRPRAYYELLLPLVRSEVRRAVLLLGPRRVGKTVLIHHVIRGLIDSGVEPKRVFYVSVDHPLYNDCGLADLLDCFSEATGTAVDSDQAIYVFFDEIQYLRSWEVHLKTLVDQYQRVRFLASGSAAAALKLKSAESGAGRFTDFLLPPLTFYEYLDLLGKSGAVVVKDESPGTAAQFSAVNVDTLNQLFAHYLNYGGYPEVLFSREIEEDLPRFIKSDIIDKVLLRDLPSLYGIQDIQELNSLFTSLAFNTANEVSLEGLSQNSGVAKNTIKRYLEYLEAAFLIRRINRIDHAGHKFKRANFFKVYLTNPSMRSALFAPISADDSAFGDLVETAVFSQWFHADMVGDLHYARWNDGEVDIVNLQGGKPNWAIEVKWSDRCTRRPAELEGLAGFCAANKLNRGLITSRSAEGQQRIKGIAITISPAALYVYMLGYNILKARRNLVGRRPLELTQS